MSTERDMENEIARSFSGKLIEAQAMWRAVSVLADKIEAKPGALSRDPDFEALIVLIRLGQRESNSLMSEIQNRA